MTSDPIQQQIVVGCVRTRSAFFLQEADLCISAVSFLLCLQNREFLWIILDILILIEDRSRSRSAVLLAVSVTYF